MDLAVLTNDELRALLTAVLTEQERREVIEHSADQAEALNDRYIRAIGRKNGDEWQQPSGAHDSYAKDSIVTFEGAQWISLIPANVWEPGVSGWREVIEEPEEGEETPAPPEWRQPTGGHDAYQVGDLVSFGGAVYRSLIAGNVWSPTDYAPGWEKVDG